jgi:hypothetical protein
MGLGTLMPDETQRVGNRRVIVLKPEHAFLWLRQDGLLFGWELDLFV